METLRKVKSSERRCLRQAVIAAGLINQRRGCAPIRPDYPISRCLVVVGLTARRITGISLSILQTILIAIFTVKFLPFHFPFAVLELRDGYPRFICERC